MTTLRWRVSSTPLKPELVHHQHYATREQATRDIAYIESFYNQRVDTRPSDISSIEMELKAA